MRLQLTDSLQSTHSIAEIEDCAIAVDASYYLQLQLDAQPYNEPLLPALGGMTGIQKRIETELDRWVAHRVVPFFIFNGVPLTGQDDVNVQRGRQANGKTDLAWDLYFNGRADDAVAAFGQHTGAYRPSALYPLLQAILKNRKLHFLVPPFNAAAQMAYFEMIDSDQCGGIMGPLELMLYPIRDSIIRSINWDAGTVTAVSKKHITKTLNVSESLFIDAFLMTGTSFLAPFPPLLDSSVVKAQPFSISDAVNMLRTSEKSVTIICTTFHDIIKTHDAGWLDKYRRARMAVSHFIYVSESGEVKVHDYERLTGDNHEYLGLQLPSELFHYLNTGLIGPRILSWIIHGQLQVLSTVDGYASDEYKKLVSTQLVPIKEAALGLLIPRLNRGIGHKDITMRVWYDRNFTYTAWNNHDQANFGGQVATWSVDESTIKAFYPGFVHGSVGSEVLSLKKPEFVAQTFLGPKEKLKGLQLAGMIKSLCLWRFLHVRGYVNDRHELTRWGTALAASMSALEPTVKQHPDVPNLFESILVGFELLRFELLNARNKHPDLRGLPLNGTEDDQSSLLLISRCATLLKLRHESNGYTGPLSKNLLAFRSLVSEVRSADRDLVESVLASMFLYAQAKRDRSDGWELSHQLPFLHDPDVALGIAVKTYFDDVALEDPVEIRVSKKKCFPTLYVPFALAFDEDLDIACNFFDAMYAGVQALDSNDVSSVDRATWDKAAKYLELRR
ncbi:nuclease-like protein [Lasiosphaeria miniovina]|uniref:Nuclease-like protein n=1 Tax=Lasiosphaeria miniovina TaxID=1954250 RepID=A0AA40E4Y8_9PEZI|nr:nuclease-like protein [Lasiosphaeria miniovina]KAK0727265.1 nuclease-like protein [Lasiosphaeria miniovina]